MHDSNRIPSATTPQNANTAITEAICPNCQVLLYVYATKATKQFRRRYYKCNQCGYRPDDNVEVVPLSEAPPQPKRKFLYQRGK